MTNFNDSIPAVGANSYYVNPVLLQDSCARSVYDSLYSNQTPVNYSAYNPNGYTTNTNPSFNGTSTQTAKKGGIGGPLIGGLLAGGATYGGMTLLNHSLNSPVEVVGGEAQFNERFLNHFAGEYAAVQNGDELSIFAKNLGGKDFKPENIENALKDLGKVSTEEGFKNIQALADSNNELKAVLENGDIFKNGQLIKGKELKDVQKLLIDKRIEFNSINAKNNYIIQSEMLERTKGLQKAWNACGNSAEAKLEFLRKNYDVLGLSNDNIHKLYSGNLKQNELNDMWKNVKRSVSAKIKTQETSVNNLKKGMQDLAKYWDDSAGLLSRGKFKFEESGLKTMEKGGKIWDALTSSTKRMRHGRALPIALIAAAVTAIVVGLSRKN